MPTGMHINRPLPTIRTGLTQLHQLLALPRINIIASVNMRRRDLDPDGIHLRIVSSADRAFRRIGGSSSSSTASFLDLSFRGVVDDVAAQGTVFGGDVEGGYVGAAVGGVGERGAAGDEDGETEEGWGDGVVVLVVEYHCHGGRVCQ